MGKPLVPQSVAEFRQFDANFSQVLRLLVARDGSGVVEKVGPAYGAARLDRALKALHLLQNLQFDYRYDAIERFRRTDPALADDLSRQFEAERQAEVDDYLAPRRRRSA